MIDKPITYKILLCEDNLDYINRLKNSLSEINERNKQFSKHYCINVDCATTPSECIKNIQNNIYDLVMLDVCRRGDEANPSDNDAVSERRSARYGLTLYDIIKEQHEDTKIFVLSNLALPELRRVFINKNIEHFICKTDNSPEKIKQIVQNYFDTEMKRIFNNVFVVYGHNRAMYNAVNGYVKKLGLNSIDLLENSNGGIQSVFDALVKCSYSIEFAIILLSADDIALDVENNKITRRARQNVIFEMGFFAGALGKDNVIVLYEKNENFEFPSDIKVVYYTEYDKEETWKAQLYHALKKAGFELD